MLFPVQPLAVAPERLPSPGEQNVLGWRPGCRKLLITNSQSGKQNNRRPGLLSSSTLFPAWPSRELNTSFGHSQREKWILTTSGPSGAPLTTLASLVISTKARLRRDPSVSNFTLSTFTEREPAKSQALCTCVRRLPGTRSQVRVAAGEWWENWPVCPC